jgi:hypothetical protein
LGSSVPGSLVLEHGPQFGPTCVRDAAGKCAVFDHVSHCQVLDHERLVLAHESSGELMQVIPAPVGSARTRSDGFRGLCPRRLLLSGTRRRAGFAVRSGQEKGKARRLHTPCHSQLIARRGACGKARGVPQNDRPGPEPAEMTDSRCVRAFVAVRVARVSNRRRDSRCGGARRAGARVVCRRPRGLMTGIQSR